MNINFSMKWALRILAALFFVLGLLLVVFSDGHVRASARFGVSNDLTWFAVALITLVTAEFCND